MAEEMTLEQQQALAMAAARLRQQQKQPTNESGIAGSIDAFGRGAANSALFGFADELGAAADYAGSNFLPWRTPKTYEQALQDTRASDAQVAADHPVANIAGNVGGAVGTGVGLGRAGLSFAGRAIDAGSSLPAVAAASALDGGIMGAAQGAGQANGDLSDRAQGAENGLIGGAVIGAALPAVTAGVGAAARKVVSPFLTNPERTAAADYLANEGVNLTAGQRTGSNALRYAESEIGGQRAEDIYRQQGEQFTSAALRRAGITANRASPDVMDQAFQDIGNQFDALAARNQLQPDVQLARDLGSTARQYFEMVPESQRAPVVMDMINDLGSTLGQGPLDGAAYQAARSRLDRAARGAANDPQLQTALYGIRNSLDDAMERSIAANNPADAGAWRDVRGRYRGMLTLEKAAAGAGENAAQGIISPQALRAATVQKQGLRNYVRGDGDFADLARSGSAVMQPMPNSGTASRLNARNLGLGLAGAAGTLTGAHTGDLASALAASGLAYAAPKVAGRVLMSDIAQALLGNQRAQAMRLSPQMQGVLNSILNVEASPKSAAVGRLMLGN